MDIQGIAGGSSQIYDKQTFGAAVVGKTIDYMHGRGTSDAAPFDKETFDASLVSTTIDNMNTNTNRYQHRNSYSFQTDVLMPAYTGRGTLLDSLA